MPGKPSTPAVRRDCPHGGRHQHGTGSAYRDDWCRCFDCRAAMAAEFRARSRLIAYGLHLPARVPSLPAALRLRALAVNGWAPRALAGHCDIGATQLGHIRLQTYPTIARTGDDSVTRLFDKLWDQRPVSRNRHERGAVVRTAQHAAAQGWLPALALEDTTEEIVHIGYTDIKPVRDRESRYLIDEIAVGEAIHGRRVALTKAEMTEAVRRLTVMGRSVSEIADILGTYDRKIARARAAA